MHTRISLTNGRLLSVWARRSGFLLATALMCFLALQPAWSSVTGTISGIVKDSSGAVVPGAVVTALNTGTGISQSVQTDALGFYVFPVLPVGTYDITIRHAGFKEYRQTGLALDATVALRVDATLQVGAATQEITVQSTSVHVETTSSQMGEIIGGTKMTTLPLNGRAYTDLLALQPGVVAVSAGTYSSQAVSGSLNAGNLSVSGQRESANGWVVNGGTVQESDAMGTSVIPNLDSIAEFRIITNNFDAEYGNYSGGQVQVVTKSGTNQYHGDLFEFLRNNDLDARNFYSDSRGVLRQNIFGGTVGGPVIHDKVFFFGDYQGTRRTVGVDSGLVAVPSPDERQGTFGPSAFGTITSDPTGQPIFTPNTVGGTYWANLLSQELGYSVTNGEAYSLYDPKTQTNLCTNTSQCVFPGGVIPQSAWSAPAQALMKFIPAPNVGSDFTTSAYPDKLRDDKTSGRLDASTRLGTLSGYYLFDDYNDVNPRDSGSIPGFSTVSIGRAQQVNFSDTKAFGANTISEFRLNYVRDAIYPGKPQGGVGPTLASQGFVVGPGTLGIVPGSAEGVEPVSLNNFSIGMNAYYSRHINNTYQALDNFSRVVGTHLLKFGADYHYDQITDYEFGALNGTFTFDGSETGNDFADFLLGAVQNYQQGAQLPMYTRGRYFGVYGHDTWRFSPSLTVNYGLRWEFSTPWWEAHNQIETLVPGLQSRVFPGAPLGWVFPGDPGVPPTLAPTRYNNFAPRIGLAYTPSASGGFLGKLLGGSGQTSIRAGYGLFYTAFEDITSFNEVGDAPYGFFYAGAPPTLFSTPFLDRATGISEGQRFPPPLPPLNVSPSNPDNNVDWTQFTPISSSPGFWHGNRLPYAEEYSLSIQRQFGPNTLLSLAYVGTQAHRLLSDLEANPGNPALCLSVNQPSQVTDGVTCGPDGENGVYHPVTGGVINGTRSPFPNTIGSNGYFTTIGNSNYNSFQTSLRHTGGRADFLLGYTWSKVMDDASNWGTSIGGQINVVNQKLGKAISAFDMAHNFVASYSYELPFDKLGSSLPRLARGWVVTGTTRFTTGLPVRLRENDDRSLLGTDFTGPTGQGVDEPNFTPGPLNFTDPRTGQPYFNKSLFSKEQLGQLGTSSREFFHGPGLNNWDLALHKDVRLTESKTLEFRGEFFNAFNHAQFGNPNGNIRSGNFGRVTSARAPRIGQLGVKILF